MSLENVDLARRASAALNRHDWTAFEDCLHPDAVYYDQTAARNIDVPAVLVGRDALMSAMLEFQAPFDDLQHEVEQVIDAGQQVISVGHWVGTGKDSGVRTELAETMVWTVRDGRLAEGRAFASLEEAMEAVGQRR